MDIRLTDVEARVLGALVEKEITTPEYYPLSLNALVNACNQKSNREPVMNLGDEDATLAMRRLGELELAGAADTTDSRVRKYEHRLQEAFNFTRPETAVLCVLLLRGAQTPGELRGRAERMYQFDDLSDVKGALQKLMSASRRWRACCRAATGDEGVAVHAFVVGRHGCVGSGSCAGY